MDAWSGCSVARGHNFTLAKGSCFDLVKKLPDASVDLICIDPPYSQGSSPPVDPKVCSYQNVAWSEAQWRAILQEGTRVLRKGGKQLIFCSNTLRRELEALEDGLHLLIGDIPDIHLTPARVCDSRSYGKHAHRSTKYSNSDSTLNFQGKSHILRPGLLVFLDQTLDQSDADCIGCCLLIRPLAIYFSVAALIL